MMNRKYHVGFAALFCGILMTGCGTERLTNQAEQPRTATTTVSKATTAKSVTETDRDHKLYEEDDVHRKTDRDEPDIIDRAESAMDSAESVLTEMMTDAEEKLDEMHEHDN